MGTLVMYVLEGADIVVLAGTYEEASRFMMHLCTYKDIFPGWNFLYNADDGEKLLWAMGCWEVVK